MDCIEMLKENQDSIEISSNAKGQFSYKVKVYGNSKTEEGRKEMGERLSALKAKADSY